jgi:hypothetical protein
VGGGITLSLVFVGVLAATTDPTVRCESCGLGFLIAVGLNLLGWLFGLTIGGVLPLFLRTPGAGSEPRG